jgi:D-alanine-D-alanine ligase
MSKKNIAVLAGGNSSENLISLMSAENIAAGLNKEKFNVYVVNISGSEWTVISPTDCGYIVNKNDFSFNLNGQKEKFDCVFPAIHGTPGEDGLFQGYLEMLDIPYVGCNVLTSSLTFNKYYCNTFLRHFNISVSDSVLVRENISFDVATIIKTTGLPCFVKPNAGGSSFGITKAKALNHVLPAIVKAFKESEEVIVEKFISGREITCGMFKTKNRTEIFPLVEIKSKNEFFDYDAKYNSALNEEIVPAPVSAELTEKCRELSSKIYDVLNCKGIVRIDYILHENEFYFLEINTLPGMTAESIVPKMIKNHGMTFTEVADLLIDDIL